MIQFGFVHACLHGVKIAGERLDISKAVQPCQALWRPVGTVVKEEQDEDAEREELVGD